MHVRFLIGVVFVLALLGMACGGDDGVGGTPRPGETEAANADELRTLLLGTGMVSIADTTYEFEITQCSIGADESDNANLLLLVIGEGTTADGRAIYAQAGRIAVDDPRTDAGQFDALLLVIRGGSAAGTPDEVYESVLFEDFVTSGGEVQPPSIQVDGRLVTASGTYYHQGLASPAPTSSEVQGSFAARCS